MDFAFSCPRSYAVLLRSRRAVFPSNFPQAVKLDVIIQGLSCAVHQLHVYSCVHHPLACTGRRTASALEPCCTLHNHLASLRGPPAGAQRSPAFAKVSGAMGRPSMWMGATLGALAGFMLAYQNSSGRLMGLRPNEDEVRQYGRL